MSIDLVTDVTDHNVQDLHPSEGEDQNIVVLFDDGIGLIFDASTSSGGTLFWRPERQVVRRETDWSGLCEEPNSTSRELESVSKKILITSSGQKKSFEKEHQIVLETKFKSKHLVFTIHITALLLTLPFLIA